MTAIEAPAPLDAEEEARLRAARRDRIAKWALPVIVMALTLVLWDRIVVWNDIAHYILPAPSRVAETLVADWAILGPAAWATIQITGLALLAAVVGGVGLAVFFTQSRLFELSFYPYAVILQVTPIIAIAPLLRIYIDSVYGVLILCAWIVAFFPILSNTTLGLNSADHNLRDLFRIYGATRWQRLRYLQLPAALPYFLGGLRIAGGLSLIGAVVAEFVVGTAGQSYGLASRILEASYRLNIPRLYAALLLISAIGVVIFAALSLLSHLLLRKWHESALKRET
ncbi:MAG: ABC transporter permease [Pikeienuella sp.]|uniref:ABC transporter permease n=1 Tax=Pikeienuella sp. TaxID=2831957 RepID=UPI00391DEBA4